MDARVKPRYEGYSHIDPVRGSATGELEGGGGLGLGDEVVNRDVEDVEEAVGMDADPQDGDDEGSEDHDLARAQVGH